MRAAAVFGALAAVLGACGGPPPEYDLVIRDVALVDVARGELVEGRTLAIRDGRIVRILDASLPPPTARETLDGSGRYVMPALTDLHTHWSTGTAIDQPEDPAPFVLRRMLYYGVTRVLNLGSRGGGTDFLDTLRARQAAGEIAGTRLYAAGSMLTVPGSHPVGTEYVAIDRFRAMELLDATPSGPVRLDSIGFGTTLVRTEEDVRTEVRRLVDWGADVIKVVVESGPDPFGDDHPQMSPAMVEAAVAEAAASGTPVVAHISSLDEVEIAVGAGVDALAHAVAPTDPAGMPSPELLALMADRGVRVITTLSFYEGMSRYGRDPCALDDPFLREALTDDEVSTVQQLLDAGLFERQVEHATRMTPYAVEFAGEAHAAGVRLLPGTDTGNIFRFPGFALHEELEMMERAGLSPADVLRAATMHTAELLGEERDFGQVAEGMTADLLVLRDNPLDGVRATRTLEAVVFDGAVVDRRALLE